MNRLLASVVAGALSASVLAATSAAEEYSDVVFLREVILQRLDNQRVGVEEVWMNPETGNRGVVVIEGEEAIGPGRMCRSYRRITEQHGAAPIVYTGRGCQDESGIWRVEPEVAATPPSVPGRDPSPASSEDVAASAPPEPAPMIPPPARKPDPTLFYASIPTPSIH